jgi:hypothetical protein
MLRLRRWTDSNWKSRPYVKSKACAKCEVGLESDYVGNSSFCFAERFIESKIIPSYTSFMDIMVLLLAYSLTNSLP